MKEELKMKINENEMRWSISLPSLQCKSQKCGLVIGIVDSVLSITYNLNASYVNLALDSCENIIIDGILLKPLINLHKSIRMSRKKGIGICFCFLSELNWMTISGSECYHNHIYNEFSLYTHNYSKWVRRSFIPLLLIDLLKMCIVFIENGVMKIINTNSMIRTTREMNLSGMDQFRILWDLVSYVSCSVMIPYKTEDHECMICFNSRSDFVLLRCGHDFCVNCISSVPFLIKCFICKEICN